MYSEASLKYNKKPAIRWCSSSPSLSTEPESEPETEPETEPDDDIEYIINLPAPVYAGAFFFLPFKI